MAIEYSKNSPYYNTKSFGQFLDLIEYRPVSQRNDDLLYTIDKIYEFRPDLLAYDLYGSSSLWWVFRSRNPNSIDDPIFDFRSGLVIYIPKKETLTADLGV